MKLIPDCPNCNHSLTVTDPVANGEPNSDDWLKCYVCGYEEAYCP